MKRLNAHRNAVAGVLALVLAAPTVALAQQAQPTATQTDKDRDAAQVEDIVVTGSRIRRSQTEGPAPVTVVTGEQMREQGFATVYEALQTLTEAIGPVQNDYDWGQTSVNASPINLRNLGPGRSLLLINGHRVADYPMPYQGKSNFANYNNIPSGIVERVEVLSGSASAIYGSDAMAGVVNVVLKDDIEGHTLRARYGTSQRGGRDNTEVVLSGGFHGDRWNLAYNLQHFDRGVLLAGDRSFMDEEADTPYLSRGVAERHFGLGRVNSYSGLYLRNRDVAGVRFIDPPAGTCDKYGGLYFDAERLAYDRNTGTETHSGKYCAQRVFKNWALRTGSEDNSGYLYGTYDITDDLQAWATVGLWSTVGQFNTFLDGFGSPIYWDPRANGGAGGARNFLKFQSPEELGGEDAILTKSDEQAIDFSVGLKGKVFGDRFNWEFMAGRATYDITETFPTLNQGAMSNYYMGAQNGTHNAGGTLGVLPVYSPDYNKLWNPVSPGDIAGFSDRGHKKAESWLNQAQFVISGDLFQGWAGPIGFAGVLEYGSQGYELTPDPKILNQDADGWYTPFGNVEQGGGERDRYAAGLEFQIPLLSNLTLNAAGRYDKYEAVASDAATTYQLGLEWRPTSTLLVRGTYGTAFRAPDMHFVYARASSGIADFTDYAACYKAGFPNNQCVRDDYLIDNATVSRAGTPDLLYEEGTSYSYGVVWDAFKNFSVSADYWSINIDNIIDDVDANQVLIDEGWCRYGKMPDGTTRDPSLSQAMCDLQISRVVRNSAGVVTEIRTGPINRAETNVAGIDASARYRLRDTYFGNFTFAANLTYLMKYESRQFPTDPLIDTANTQNPRMKITTSVAWTNDRWSGTLMMYQKSGGRNNRWNDCRSFEDGFRPSPGNACKDLDAASPTFGQSTELEIGHRPPRRYFNASLGYQLTDRAQLNVYVSNLFNSIYQDKYCGDFAYCVDDPVGREFAGEIVYRF